MTLSAMEHVLSIPEILTEIFEFSDKRTNASNLVVNKAWSREVINVEWGDVKGWSRMLGLLAPVELKANTLGFCRPVVQADHERFNEYASRVRSLALKKARFEPSVSNEITRIVSDIKFVSNLTHLSCSITDTHALKLFLNPTLSSLSIGRMEDVWPSPEVLQSILSIIKERNPPLVSLKLMADYLYIEEEGDDLRMADPVLASALPSFTRLTSCHLPPDILSPAVSEAMSALPNLESLNSLGPRFSRCKSSLFSTHLSPAAFPSLRSLSITISFERAIVSFAAWGKSDTLTSLELLSNVYETPERFKNLSEIVSQTFEHLTALCITAYASPSGGASSTRDVVFEHLEPLLSLDQLRDLSLHHLHPLHLYENDIVSITASLKNLTRLHLNPAPREQQHPRFHITVLSNANLCSGTAIKDLGLYIKTSFDRRRRRFLPHATEESDRRSSLEVLHLGASPLIHRDVVPLVEYLVGVLPNKCKIVSMSDSDDSDEEDSDEEDCSKEDSGEEDSDEEQSDEEESDEEDPILAPWKQFHDILRVVKGTQYCKLCSSRSPL